VVTNEIEEKFTSRVSIFLPVETPELSNAVRGMERSDFIDFVEDHPSMLVHLYMDFASRTFPDSKNKRTLFYECNYFLEFHPDLEWKTAYRIRFTDKDFHNLMFGNNDLGSIEYYMGTDTASPIVAYTSFNRGTVFQVAETRADIFLPDGVTLVGSFWIRYPKPV
jgi:hypothetical protein